MENLKDDVELTQEELTARKDEMMGFYTESMPYLEAQLKYEETLLKIDEARFKRASVQIQYAMLIQKSKEESKPEQEFETKTKK